MNEQTDFERLVADQLASVGTGMPPESAITETIARAGGTRRLPEWLAYLKEPPMRTNSHLAVGSPTVRVVAIMAATMLLALALAAAGAGAQRLLAADDPIVVAQDGSGDYTTIAEAVVAAVDGDEIVIRPGTYVEAVTVEADIALTGDGAVDEIVVTAPDDGPTSDISNSGGDWDREPYALLLLDTEATLSGFTLRGAGATVIASGGSPVLSGLHVDGVGRAHELGSGSTGNSMVITGGSTATVRGITITDGGPIGVFDLSEPLIEANTLRGGPYIWGGYGDGAVIRGNTIDGSLAQAIYVGDPASPTIEGNTITNPGEDGLTIGDGSPAVLDNTISGAGVGVSVYGSSEPTISGNSLADNRIAISWSGGDGGLVEQNTVSGGKAGIIVGGGSPVVRDNTVEGVEARGIVVLRAASPVLSGNTSCGNGENLFVVDGAMPEDDGTNQICEDAQAE